MMGDSAFRVSELPEARRAEAAQFVAASGHRRAGAVSWIKETPAPYAPLCRGERVALAKDAVMGFAGAWEQYPGFCRCELFVADGGWERGVADALLESLLTGIAAWPERNEIRVQARAESDDAAELALLARHGFTEVHRMTRLELDVTTIDEKTRDAAIGKMAALGVRLTTLAAERETGREPMPDLWRTKNAALSFWADPYGGREAKPLTYKEFLDEEHWRAPAETVFLAAHGQEFIGYSGLWDDTSAPHCMGTTETAVRPEWHGRGVASALKASALRFAREREARMVWTTTASPTMRAVKEKFGFRQVRAEVRLARRVMTGVGEAK